MVFTTWVQELLLPSLNELTVIVMDNVTFHKDAATLQLIKAAGHIIEFLPPYSPDLNPIEHKWAEKKAEMEHYHQLKLDRELAAHHQYQ